MKQDNGHMIIDDMNVYINVIEEIEELGDVDLATEDGERLVELILAAQDYEEEVLGLYS